MTVFLLTFAIFITITIAMAIGYIVQQKSISGSCGGLGALGIDKACDCPEPCDRRKAREAKETARAEKLASWKENQIL